MYTHFEALEENKKDRILRAAMGEFGKYGYEKTSTEQIAQAAEISKGMLFHYFGNKIGLFSYLMEEAHKMVKKLAEPLGTTMRDLDYLEMYRHITKNKLQLTIENQEVFVFMTMLYTLPEHGRVSEKVEKWISDVAGIHGNFIRSMAEHGQKAPFRKEMGAEKSMQYIEFMMAGFTEFVMATLRTDGRNNLAESPLWSMFDEMLDDLKMLFYERGEKETHA